MGRTSFAVLQRSFWTVDFRQGFIKVCVMGELEKSVARRLRAVMDEFGIRTNPEMAEVCGTTSSAVNNWLLGYNLPRVPQMQTLCGRTGLTLDWIYSGSMAVIAGELGIR